MTAAAKTGNGLPSVEWLLWGKTGRKQGDGTQEVHPLLCHMLDVAAVSRALWDEVLSPAARQAIAAEFQLAEDDAGRWVALFAALHDLGKACPAFQVRHQPAYELLQRAGMPCPRQPPPAAHGAVTAYTLPAALEPLNLPRRLAADVATALGGHHGAFPAREPELRKLEEDASLSVGGEPWTRLRRIMATTLAQIIGAAGATPPARMHKATAMTLAGFVSVSDWIGSDESCFPYLLPRAGETPGTNGRAYADLAADNARRALERLRWTGWSPSSDDLSFAELFPAIRTPSAVQRAVVALAPEVEREPSLVILEAPMGCGKTEAALYLADRWGSALGQRGCYFALPTMATSNQMFGRVRDFLAHRFRRRVVNLQLVHGHAALSAELEPLRERGRQPVVPRAIYDERASAQSDRPAEVLAAEWFTYRKRGLLAPYGVGTVDQALLAALRTRHVFVRLFGLAHKVVVVDEVHAYDTYMTSLLERLLEWLAALGSSVVLLSATLPRQRRGRVVRAYARGLGLSLGTAGSDSAGEDSGYPRLTWVTTTEARSKPILDEEQIDREVRLVWVDGRVPQTGGDAFPLGERLAKALEHGGCAAVICNTVRRAQRVYEALKPHFQGTADDGLPELDLFHAQYLYEHREAREQRAHVRFRKPDGHLHVQRENAVARSGGGEGDPLPVRRPRKAVLVATQVIEQSLDLDFDLMVTDQAPIDLVLQRSGRLHRHQRDSRPPGLESPTLWVCEPEQLEGGVPGFGRANERVYHPHVLLRSWLALRETGKVIRIPSAIDDLVEAVYDDKPCPEGLGEAVRRKWEGTRDDLRKKVADEREEAEMRWLKPPYDREPLWRFTADSREEDAPDFHEAFQALTRLTQPTAQVVCLWATPAGPALDPEGTVRVNVAEAPHVDLARRLLRRSVTVSDWRGVRALLGEEVPPGWRRSALLRHHRLVQLTAARNARVGDCQVHVDDELGVRVTPLEGRA